MNNLLYVAVLLLASMLAGCPVYDVPTPKPSPNPTPTPVVIDSDMKTVVASIESYSIPELAPLYRDFADVIERDSSIIRTTGDIREGYTRAGTLAFQKTDMISKTPGLAAQIDKILEQELGLQNTSLTTDKRAHAVKVFRAISAALE